MSDTHRERILGLTPDEKKQRRRQQYRISHQKYLAKHKGEIYEPKLRIPISQKADLMAILSQENLTISQLFFALVQEKYGIDLSLPK